MTTDDNPKAGEVVHRLDRLWGGFERRRCPSRLRPGVGRREDVDVLTVDDARSRSKRDVPRATEGGPLLQPAAAFRAADDRDGDRSAQPVGAGQLNPSQSRSSAQPPSAGQ